ncbi:MAG: 4Fe-4S dicluster domain-containing protein [Woeseiaceae bacterium]|nr:4Fe-4S dicluster domain-containing protein [Woeseiaceae bacterium]
MSWTLADRYSLDDVLAVLGQGREVYALETQDDGRYKLSRDTAWQAGRHTLGAFRQTEPLKALFFPPREFIGRWKEEATRQPMPERIVYGVKNCDLSSLAIFDHVFLDGVVRDPYYAEAREKTVLVSTDCSGQLDVCFCPAVGEQPYARQGFDINIAETPEGVLIESGSGRGEELLRSAEQYLQPAGDDLLAAIEKQRARRYRELTEQSEAHGLAPGTDLRAAVEGAFGSELWGEFARDCVECGACNYICCTCHCFLLADGMDEQGVPARTKLWDACLYSGFARTAGGGTPRPFRAERLRNRFDKKFSYFPQVLGRYACDGCGRCTEACIADIDIRRVLKRAVDESSTLHAGSGSN